MTCTVVTFPPRCVSSSTTDTTHYPQAVGSLVLESGAVLKLKPGAVYYIRPSTSSTQETRIKASSTLEITA